MLSTATGGNLRAAGDDALVAAAARGSSDAFSILVERHQQALRAFLRRSSRDWHLADDLAQEAFITAWSRIGRLKPGANVRAWLCGIGYNKFLTTLRADRRARLRDADYGDSQHLTPGGKPEDRIALDRAMSELSVEQRACVALCLAADFSHSEAAEALSLPIGTIKTHIARGRARLLQVLGAKDE